MLPDKVYVFDPQSNKLKKVTESEKKLLKIAHMRLASERQAELSNLRSKGFFFKGELVDDSTRVLDQPKQAPYKLSLASSSDLSDDYTILTDLIQLNCTILNVWCNFENSIIAYTDPISSRLKVIQND